MKKKHVIQSPKKDVDTLWCPKCGALWRAKGYYDYDEGGWVHEYEDEFCPNGCRNILGLRIMGNITE
ncbi:hypothetical protein [Clostridium sp.]|uniref:hypothetical protein n=1 Tax=Clostridium sp. TaxID=1506 RepID=UPI002588B547|nr:hypothetical protein [Clostridium sp.]MDF2505224.1 hypothetical protein [Clostridium sp.]